MKVLIAYEESQTVAKAFRELGHEAYSCDLQPCSGEHPEWHLLGDAMEAMKVEQWDLIIMHPECTAVSVSGNSTYAKGKPGYSKRLKAVEYTQKAWNLATSLCDKVVMENPLGVLNTFGNFPRPQYIQPHEFGHDASKLTGLWLKGLPKLTPTEYIEPRIVNGKKRWSNQTDSGQNNLGPTEDRAKIRSTRYPGIAEAFATQYGIK